MNYDKDEAHDIYSFVKSASRPGVTDDIKLLIEILEHDGAGTLTKYI